MDELLNSEANSLGINKFLESAEKYTKNNFSNLNLKELFYDSLTGNIGKSIRHIGLIDVFCNEISPIINMVITVFVVIIIHSIFKAITDGLKNKSASNIIYFIQYLIIITIVINSYVSILSITKTSIENIIEFMNILLPFITTLMLTTGMITTTSAIEPILLFMINFIGLFINSFIIPFLLLSITISIISNISDKTSLNRLANFLKSSIVWSLGIVLTIFAASLSLEGTITSTVDGITAKTAKAAVSSFIPVVGKIMGDTVDSVIGCGNILKNSVGFIGIIIIIGIVAIPIIRISILWISFKMTSAISEVIADEKIVNLIDQLADSYKILLAILFSVSIMFIIGITIVIKITNSGLMYR